MRSGRSSCLGFGTGRTRRSRRNQAASDVPRGLRSCRTGELEIGLSRSGVVNSVLCYFPVTLFLDRCIYITKLDANQLKFFQGLTQGKAKNLDNRPDVSRPSLRRRQTAARVLTIASQRSTAPCGEIKACMLSRDVLSVGFFARLWIVSSELRIRKDSWMWKDPVWQVAKYGCSKIRR